MQDQHIKILLIEDNLGDSRLIQEMLREAKSTSFILDCTDKLSTGLECISSEEYDAILLDLSLPDSLGLETFTKVKKQAPRVPVIVLTGLDDESLAVKAVREGAQDYLAKSELDTNLLLRAIRYAIERRRAEIALLDSEERYALAVRGANDGLWDWDIKSDEFYISPRCKEILGYENHEIGNNLSEWYKRVHPEDLNQVMQDLHDHLNGLTPHFENEHRELHNDGEYRWLLTRGLAVLDENGIAYRMAGSQTDITQRKRVEKQLHYDAFHDALTGLSNRALFVDRLKLAIERAKRRKDNTYAVLFMDLDRFKQANDTYGHSTGDKLLIAVAHRFEDRIRATDTFARFGGDEFAFLLVDGDSLNDATQIARRLLKELNAPFNINEHDIYISASIGIVTSHSGYERTEEVLRDADVAMYKAKDNGGSCYVIFESSMRDRALNLIQMESQLRKAIENQEFLLHYQPIVDLETCRVTGFEALVRWLHPVKGLVYPSDFISIAEETGIIIPIGNWVLREACQQLLIWQTQFPIETPLTMSVNLSSKQFSQYNLVEIINSILAETKLKANFLRLEITESVLLKTNETALRILTELTTLGILVQIDDFGTGYSSLSYLHQLPIDAIKIDRSFVNRIDSNGNNSEIVKTILTLAKDLGIYTIAEGVETLNQLKTLQELKCEFAQGNLFYRPQNHEAITALIKGMVRSKTFRVEPE